MNISQKLNGKEADDENGDGTETLTEKSNIKTGVNITELFRKPNITSIVEVKKFFIETSFEYFKDHPVIWVFLPVIPGMLVCI